MTWTMVERFDPHWCCGICGQEKPKGNRATQYDCRDMYGRPMQHHVWVWWERDPLLDKTPDIFTPAPDSTQIGQTP